MSYALSENSQFLLSILPPANFIVPLSPMNLMVRSSDKILVNGYKISLASDMQSQPALTSIPYIKAGFNTPGVLSWDGKLNDYSEFDKITKDGNNIISNQSSSGSVEFKVVTQSQLITAVSTTPDPQTTYKGRWSLISLSQYKLMVG